MEGNRLEEISLNTIFEDVFKSEKIVILFFCTNRWKPCLNYENTLLELQNKNKELIKIYRVNYDKDKELCREFEVNSLPTLIFFKNGQEKIRQTGSQNIQQLEILLSTLE